MKKIPIKNYCLLALLFIVTIVIILYLVNWYNTSQSYYTESSIMTNFLGEIKETELGNYILENPEILIYVSSNQEIDTKKFEKKLKDYIIKEDMKSSFIYLNCENISEEFIKNFQKKYFKGNLKNIHLTYPNLLFVSEGKIQDVLYKLETNPDMKDVKEFLKQNGVVIDA